MDLRVLRCFLTIAKEQGFTKAAEQLHITQPTLSRQLAAFEEGLDYIRITDSDHWVGGMRPDDPLAGKGPPGKTTDPAGTHRCHGREISQTPMPSTNSSK